MAGTRSNIEASILKLEGFPTRVLELAVEEYRKLDVRAPRSNKNKILCYCICQAYVRTGELAVDPVEVGSKLGMDPTSSNLAVRNRPKYKIGEKSASPTAAVEDILRTYGSKRLDLPRDVVESMLVVLQQLLTVAPGLLSLQAKPLVVAFIYSYIPKNSMGVNKDQLCRSLFTETDRVEPALREIEKAVATHDILF